MLKVDLFPFVEEDSADLRFAVIVGLHKGQWVFVKHRERETLELPGGRREPNEPILETARRELREETGAERFHLIPLNAYAVTRDGTRTRGLLCFAWIESFGELPPLEIEKRLLLDTCPLPAALTYPMIQPLLFESARRRMELLRWIEGYDHVIWDWNGTLLNDLHTAVDSIGQLLVEHSLPELTIGRYRDIFGFPVADYYRRLGFDFSKTTFEKLGDRFIENYNARSLHAQLFEGTRELLGLISTRGIQQSILSAASQWHLEEITRHFGIDRYFARLFGIDNHYAASKLERGRELLRASAIAPRRTLMIGDTDHDCHVGRELGVDVLLVADGHQSYERLRAIHDRVLKSRYPVSW